MASMQSRSQEKIDLAGLLNLLGKDWKWGQIRIHPEFGMNQWP
jgi:hypothetical protein